MAFFRYSATDARGKPLQGTIQAADENAALVELQRRGFQSVQLLASGTAAPARTPTPVAPAPKPAVRRTRKISDRQRFYLFAQISDQLRAGVNPANAFTAISSVTRLPEVRQALQAAGEQAMRGGRISDVLEQYPDLFPDHVATTVRAGEEGGFLPAAAMQISDQAGAAYKFKRFHWFVWLVALNALLAIPIALLATSSFTKAFEKIDKTGGEGGFGSGLASIASAFIETLIWPAGPMVLATYTVFFVLYLYFGSDRFRLMRHRLGLHWPVLGKRAKHEGVTVFTWVLSKLANAGISPWRTWELASGSVPNLVLRRKLEDAGERLQAGSKVSEAIFGSKLFPEDYAPVIATGEMTGDLVGALERLAEMSRTDFEAATAYAKVRTSGWGCLGGCVTAGAILIVLLYWWFHQLIPTMLKGLELPD